MGKLTKLSLTEALLASALMFVVSVSPTEGAISETEIKPGFLGSRFVNAQEYDSYIATLSESLRITLKSRDPFGNSQDLTVKPTPEVSTSLATVETRAVPLSTLVERIKIGMILFDAKKIVVGTRPYGVGDKLTLTYNGKLTDLILTEVASERLVFRCVQTGEIVIRQSKQRPSGLTPATRGDLPKGLSSGNQTAPINLEDDESAP